MNLRFLSFALLFLPTLSSCNAMLPAEKQFEEAKTCIEMQNYDEALDILEHASDKTLHDKTILAYNKAVVHILNGSCDTAIRELNAMIHAESILGLSQYAQNNTSDDESSVLAQFYLAMTIATLCPTLPSSIPTEENDKKALEYLAHASSHGGNYRNLIGQIYQNRVPDCKSFIPITQPDASSPQNAYPLQNLQTSFFSFILCPREGNWFAFQARKHEIFHLAFTIHALQRQFWLDDSSRLPFIKMHVDIYQSDSNPSTLPSPIASFTQPLPKTPPKDEDFLQLNLHFGSIEIPENGRYLTHFYTEDNGEAFVIPKITKIINCEYIDDIHTYDDQLKQQKVVLKNNTYLTNLVFCPNRPDIYEFSLTPGQSALIAISSDSSSLYQQDALYVELENSKRQKIPIKLNNIQPDTQASLFIAPSIDDYRHGIFIYLKNTQNINSTYLLSLSSNLNSDETNYTLAYATSHDCSKTDDVTQNIDFYNDTEPVFVPPEWICPNQNFYYTITQPSGDGMTNAKFITQILSQSPIAPENVSLNTMLIYPNDNQKYLSESAIVLPQTSWIAPHAINAYILQKPILHNAQIQLNSTTHGFVLSTAIPSQEKSSNTQNKQDKKDSKNDDDGQNKSKNENKPSQDPQKPSNTPATPQGDGNDTNGNESTPSTTENGNANLFDPQKTERDHIDALLDAIEQGDFYVPIPGSIPLSIPDKNW